jgi:uncharacterized RDD family membrane protein YckC
MFGGRKPVVQMPADGPATSGGDLSYGGFWARFAALIIDNAILTIVAMVLMVIASLVDESLATLASIVYLVGALLYWPVMESSARQATLGKDLLGLQVTDAAGQRLSFVRALLRTLAKIISALPLYIGFLLAAFTSRKQALHDIIVSTVVLRTGQSHFLKAAGATAAAIVVTVIGGYYYMSSLYNVEAERAEKAMQAAQKGKPPAKPVVEQAQAPGAAFPAGGKPPAPAEQAAPAPAKPAPSPVAVQPTPAPAKPAAAPTAPEPAPKAVATAPAKEAAPMKVAAPQVKEPAPAAKPAAAPAPAKAVTAEPKPVPAQPVAPVAAAPAKPAAPSPAKAAAAKPRPAPRPEPVTVAAAADEAPKAAPPAPAPRPARPPVEVTTVPAAASAPMLTYNDIMTAVMYRDRAAAAQLLDLGWWPDRRDSNGVTPLMAAAMNGDAEMTELLLSRGADPQRRGPGGSTLDYAGRGGNAQVLELLRKAGAR